MAAERDDRDGTESGRANELRARERVDLSDEAGGVLRVTGPDPTLVFAVPGDLVAPRGVYLRCAARAGQTILRHAELEIVERGTTRRVPLRPEVFLGGSQQLDLTEGGGELRLHLGRDEGTVVPAALILDPVPPFAVLRHAARIANRRTGSSLLRKARTALDLIRSEGLGALMSRIDAIGHGIGHARTPLGDPARDYAAWAHLYGAGAGGRAAAPPPAIGLLLLQGGAGASPRASLTGQGLAPEAIGTIGGADSPPAVPDREWVAVVGCDGRFDPACLATLGGCPALAQADLVYFDSDAPAADGGGLVPDFKPGWDEHLALQQDCLGPLLVRLGHLDLDAAKDARDPRNARLAIALAALRRGARVAHVEEVLFHHDTPPGGFDDAALAERAEVVRRHLGALGLAADVAPRRETETLQVTYRRPRWPSVSVVMPTRDNMRTLPAALASLLRGTDYPALEVIVVDNGSRRQDVLDLLAREAAGDGRLRTIRHDRPFNFSELINVGAAAATGELLLLLNDDVEALEPGWLKLMASHFARSEAGAVGAKLMFPDGTIQHAGVALGVGGGVAGHIYLGLPGDTRLNRDRAQLTRRVAAVTGACLLTPRDLYREIGGLDEDRLAVAYNDIDYCLEVARRGREVIYEPRAVLTHHESHSRGRDNNPEKRQRLLREVAHFGEKWGDLVFHDPFYSGNHALFSPHFRFAHPPRRRTPR